ncbi:TOM1-like protein 6 isoform X2 [Durio zibethinus]|uniref:TOM1-like protein 6 isoform X2 n=1 Tax=Durio zibethinus TaxID=66656 RepID=A0A6P5Y040_DURZI|nr:TOM1-like protein 6 isoform X2 [Durio zibethinus]
MFEIAERNILGEMVKIVRKKADMLVRDKILALLDSWQEAFGGPGGKHPQYYRAYDELRRSGVVFPKRSSDAAPIFALPATRATLNHPGYGMPSNSSRRLDETMATEIESLSLSSLDSMRDVNELLSDMLLAVNPSDSVAVKDEVIVDLVNRCRSNQKKLMQMLTTTGDEELLARGLELNDGLQSLLAKHDAIASGSLLPIQVTSVSSKPTEASTSNKSNEVKNSNPAPNISPPAPVATVTRSQIDEEEDDFAQLARRHSRAESTSSQSTSAGRSQAIVPINNTTGTTSYVPTASASTPSNALALPDAPAPAPVRTTKEQDLIDLLSLTLSTSASFPPTPPTPSASHQNIHQVPVPPSTEGYPYASLAYPGSQGQLPYNSYVVPWAQPHPQKSSQPQVLQQYHSLQKVQVQPQPQPQIDPQSPPQSQFQAEPQTQIQSSSLSQAQHQFQTQSQPQLQLQSQSLQLQAQYKSQHQAQQQTQPQLQAQSQNRTQSFLQYQPHFQSQYPQYSSGYPPPPWAATPGNFNGQNHLSSPNNMFSTPHVNAATSNPVIGSRPFQHVNPFPTRSNGAMMNRDSWAGVGPRNPAPVSGRKLFIPSYRLFEDLNVLGNADGRLKMTSSTSPSLSGSSTQGMVGGRK